MSSVKEHYDQHLGNFYSWMLGDFQARVKEELQFLQEQQIQATDSALVLDLGAGNGIHTLALAKAGFRVKAIDFNPQLLSELKVNAASYAVEIIKDDIRNLQAYADPAPDLIMCAGDTIAHLHSWEDVRKLLRSCCESLAPEGLLVLSFRDYSRELKGSDRFIPVKSDDNRILTCLLEYEKNTVMVTDLLYEKMADGWQQKQSSYKKVRLTEDRITEILKDLKMNIRPRETRKGMLYAIAEKL